MPLISISIEEVYHQLSNLQSNKASGPDKIPVYSASLIAPILFLIFQSSLNQGILPSDWKTANIIPIYKKGNRSQPRNYRLVSLTSICCKALERIIYSHVLHHLQAHGILCEEQHGFQTGKSCDSQLIVTINDFANCLNGNKQIDAIFFDFSKVFDKVPHQRLFNKLPYYGIKGSTLVWIQNYLINRNPRRNL